MSFGRGLFALATLAVLTTSCSKPSNVASASAAQAAAVVTVPYVGCAQDGQTGPKPAPTGAPKVVQLDAATASKLAYYVTSDGLGVLGPKGWSCFGTYGSDAMNLFVAPQPITFPQSGSISLTGPAIQVSSISGDTSGRFTVAEVVARVFPAHQAFAQSVINEGIEPASGFPSGPVATDTITTKSPEWVEYQTRANTAGLGVEHSFLKASGDPISGVAILTDQTPDLLFAAVRLSPDLISLAPAIVHQVELDNSTSPASQSAAQLAPAQAPAAPSQPASNSAALSVVQSFYSALNGGFGGTASTLMVPEKQSGNFSPGALTKFYGSAQAADPAHLILVESGRVGRRDLHLRLFHRPDLLRRGHGADRGAQRADPDLGHPRERMLIQVSELPPLTIRTWPVV